MRAFEEFFAYELLRNLWVPPRRPDEVLYVSNNSGQLNLWRRRLRSRCPERLTFYEEWAVWFGLETPYGILLLMDFQGRERHQMALLQPGRWPERLTRNLDHFYRFDSQTITPDGRFVVLFSDQQDPRFPGLFLYDLERRELRSLLHQEGRQLMPQVVSPDGQWLLAIAVLDLETTEVLLVHLATGESEVLLPARKEVTQVPVDWHPSGRGFYVLTDQDHEFTWLGYYDLEQRTLTPVAQPEHDVEWMRYHNGTLYWVENHDGRHVLLARREGAARTRRFRLPAGNFSSLRLVGDFLYLVLEGARFPSNLLKLHLRSGRYRKVAGGFYTDLSEDELVEPESVRYRSFDGLPIQAWLYRPKEVQGRVPVVLSIHGGPNWQERPLYSGFYQYLLQHGVAVFAPNYRGSTGFGKTFKRLIYRDWGGAELRDLEKGVRWLLQQPWVDPQRIAVFGGSFGGFATLSCLTRLPQYFCCGVDIMGPSNLVTFAGSVPEHWKPFMAQIVGDPEKDRDLLLERSPITYVENLRVPLLVIQGANDPRVVKAESDQMVEALRRRGVPVEYVVFEDEGHGFTKRANQVRAFRLSAEFLLKHLKGTG